MVCGWLCVLCVVDVWCVFVLCWCVVCCLFVCGACGGVWVLLHNGVLYCVVLCCVCLCCSVVAFGVVVVVLCLGLLWCDVVRRVCDVSFIGCVDCVLFVGVGLLGVALVRLLYCVVVCCL